MRNNKSVDDSPMLAHVKRDTIVLKNTDTMADCRLELC